MSKTDDIIKYELSNIGDYKDLKMRGFIGSSNYDQRLWSEGGLTFGFDGNVYGSNDFAWFKNEEWYDPYSGETLNTKPIIIVEGTHCLNTKSYGTAQIQRFHHAYSPFRNGVISIYYLKKGKYSIRHELLKAVYNANILHDYRNKKTCYLVTEDIEDISKLVKLIGDHGESSEIVWSFIDGILNKMNNGFLDFFESKNQTFEEYLNSRAIFKFIDENNDTKWIKFLGPKKASFTDSSQRYGHIVLGEAFVAKYLISNFDSKGMNSKLYYYFPLINQEDFNEITNSLTSDKEWNILSQSTYWELLNYDDVEFDDPEIKKRILPFREMNLNTNRKAWNLIRKNISQSLQDNSFKITK